MHVGYDGIENDICRVPEETTWMTGIISVGRKIGGISVGSDVMLYVRSRRPRLVRFLQWVHLASELVFDVGGPTCSHLRCLMM